jgi:WD40 repeat protein
LSTGTILAEGRIFGSYSLALSPNGRYLAVGAQKGNVFIYESNNLNQPILNKQLHLGRLRSLAWSPDSMLLASGDANNNVRIIDITTKTIVYTLPLGEVVNDLSWEPGNTGRLAIASNAGTVIVWNLHTNQYTSYIGHQGPVTTVSWGKQALASGSTDKTIIIWTF